MGWFTGAMSAVGDWASRNKSAIVAGLAAAATATVVTLAVGALLPVATFGIGALMVAGAVAGLASAAVNYVVQQKMDGKRVDGWELARQCCIGVAVGTLTAGAGKYLLPAFRAGATPVVASAAARAGLSQQAEKMLVEGAAKGVMDAAIAGDTQVAKNLFDSAAGTKPWSEWSDGVAQATAKAGAKGALEGAASPIVDPLKEAAAGSIKSALPGVKAAVAEQARKIAPAAAAAAGPVTAAVVIGHGIAPVSSPTSPGGPPVSTPSAPGPHAPCKGIADVLADRTSSDSARPTGSGADAPTPAPATSPAPSPSPAPTRRSTAARTIAEASLGDD